MAKRKNMYPLETIFYGFLHHRVNEIFNNQRIILLHLFLIFFFMRISKISEVHINVDAITIHKIHL